LALTNFGVKGTDLGFSFDHRGRIYFLFGDTWAPDGVNRGFNSDTIGYVTPSSPKTGLGAFNDLCLHFKFVTESPNMYAQVRLDGKTLGTEDVPISGFSNGVAMYAFFLRHAIPEDLNSKFLPAILAVSNDGGVHFQTVIDDLPENFQEVSPMVIDSRKLPGLNLPWSPQPIVLFFNKKLQGLPYLSVSTLQGLHSSNSWYHFAGWDAGGGPIWSIDSRKAVPIVCQGNIISSGAAELSVWFEPGLNQWLMMYETDFPSPPANRHPGIRIENADTPWGPWTKTSAELVDTNDAYCHFIYRNTDGDQHPCDDRLDQTGEFGWLEHKQGRPYGAYAIPQYTEWDEATQTATIYFVMSTFNPYSPVIMRVPVRLEQVRLK